MIPTITALYAGLTGVLLCVLSFRISLLRRRLKVSRGDGGDRSLSKAIRVQANLTEYAAIVLLLMLLAELQAISPTVLHILGTAFVGGRVLHVIGLGSSPQRPLARTIGMLLTYGVLACAALINVAMIFL